MIGVVVKWDFWLEVDELDVNMWVVVEVVEVMVVVEIGSGWLWVFL